METNMETTNTETLYITIFTWVAVPTHPGRVCTVDGEPTVCNSYREILALIAADDEDMRYAPAMRVTRIDRDFFDGDFSPKTIDRLTGEYGPDVCATGLAYITDDTLPEQTEIVWPTRVLRLEVPNRYRREVATRGWTVA